MLRVYGCVGFVCARVDLLSGTLGFVFGCLGLTLVVLRLSWVDSLVGLVLDLIAWFGFVVVWVGLFGWV